MTFSINFKFYSFAICCVTVRLANGPTNHDGIVEMYRSGVWRTVCGDQWDLNDGQVVCSELSIGNVVAVKSSYYKAQRVDFHFLNCTGSELSTVNCSYSEWPWLPIHCGTTNSAANVKCTSGIYFYYASCKVLRVKLCTLLLLINITLRQCHTCSLIYQSAITYLILFS